MNGGQGWRERAACAGLPTDLFYPTGWTDSGAVYAAAKRVCDTCPVRHPCLVDELDRGGPQYGMRGGLRPDQRDQLLRRRDQAGTR